MPVASLVMPEPAPLPRVLAILGSGETAPTMIKPHRALFDRLGTGKVDAVALDTPYGFQANAEDLSARTMQYFHQSVGRSVEIAQLRRTEGVDPLEIEQALARLRRAQWIYAGPGSPTYALRQWAPTDIAVTLADKLRYGGVVVFSSAAALTLGRYTVPVYEVYKVGVEPFWLDGLDLLGTIGLPVALIPHYDNAEGGNHDTRFCYLGEPRLAALEEQLPDGTFVLGVDEHTGLVLDLDADIATVIGNGVVTVRRAGRSITYACGETLPIDRLRYADSGTGAGSPAAKPHQPAATSAPATSAEPVTLGSVTRGLAEDFRRALAAGDADGAVSAALGVVQALVDWAADTTQSDDPERARAALRTMLVELGGAARNGLTDPRATLEPVVAAALALRTAVRAEKRYDLSDLLRDHLANAGIEVRDTPNGPAWEFLPGPS